MPSQKPVIVFAHGNSFPGSTYNVLLNDLRQRGFDVSAVDRFGHEERYQVTNNWPNLVQQLADFATEQVERTGQKVYLVGHSLGGILSLMAAARHPHLACGVLLIDSPIISGWRANALDVVKRTQMVGSLSPGKISRARRNTWASTQEAFDHFRTKKAFARWDERVLRDYVEHGLVDSAGKRILAFDRAVETAIYNTLPHNLAPMLKKHPLQCPAAFIGGLESVEMRQVGMTLTQRVTEGRIMMLDGSHLFPMEQPHTTAAAVEASLRNIAEISKRR